MTPENISMKLDKFDTSIFFGNILL